MPELKENKERGIGDIKVMNEIEIIWYRMLFFLNKISLLLEKVAMINRYESIFMPQRIFQ